MDERHRVALEAVLAGMALRPRLLADLLEARRGGREIAVEALEALSRAVERAEGGAPLLHGRIIASSAPPGQAVNRAGSLSALARRIIEATPPSLRYLLHGLVEEPRAGGTPREAVEALRPKLAALTRDAAEAFKSAEDVEYLAKSFGVKSSSEEEILRAFEDAFLRAAERISRLPEDRRRDALEYIERRLGRLLRIAGIAALGVALAVLANDPAWLRRSAEAAGAIAGAHAALPVVIFAVGLAKRAGAEEAAEAAKSITAAVIRQEILKRAKDEKWRRFMDVEEADLVVKGPNIGELVLNGAKIGEIVGERIEGDPRVDAKLKIELPDLRVELELNEGRLREAVEEWKKLQKIVQRVNSPEELEKLKEELESVTKELERLGRNLGDMAFAASAVRYSKEGRSKVVEDAFMLASALERQMRAMFGESAEEIGEGIWREVYRLDEVLSDRAFEVLREKIWELHTIEEDARIVAEYLPQYREYVERLEKIAALLKTAAKELVEEAEREGKGSVKWIKGRPYIAYEGPAELSARVEHVEKDGKTYAVIEVKYGDRTARVELEVEKYWRSGLLHNLAAIATDDRRNFYKGYVSHSTASFVQAVERLMAWAIFMPGEYALKVGYVKETEEGLSPEIEIRSYFGQDGLAKIEKESPIHRLVLKLARELASEEKPNVDKVLAASWLMISAILSTPDDKKPSEGFAILVEKGVLPRAALDRLRPIFEGLDALLGSVSREDKAYLVGKMVDYDGSVEGGRLLVSAEKIKEMPIELDGVEIRMADVAEAAAKAFWKEGGWSGDHLYFGPAREALELEADGEAPLKIPAYKAMAALIAQKADELRRKELVEHVELYRREIDGGEIKIMAPKAKEGEQTPIAQLEAIWREFKIGKYAHLRLVIGGEEYELFYSGGRFGIAGEKAQKLKKALEELGLDVKLTSGGYFRLSRKHLEALLNKGVKAYAVRKAKKGEVMWRLEITYKGMTIVLKMTYDERNNYLVKFSRTGKIEVTYKEGASEGKRVELDLGLLAAAGRDCSSCPEKWFAEALNAASEKLGFKWSVTSDRKYLYVHLSSDFRDVVHRFYSNA